MLFNSYSYLLLLLPAAILFWALPLSARRWYILSLGLAYYAAWSAPYLPVPLIVALIAFAATRTIARDPAHARRSMWIAIATILALFLSLRIFSAPPLGLSFFSFAAIALIIDAKQGRIKNARFSQIYSLIMFFPTLMAGPILRFRELAPQLEFKKPFELDMLIRGLDRLILGLVQKNLIANTLAGWVVEGFAPNATRTNSTIDNWALALAFGLQIYFDFAAYSNMAIGVAQLIGVNLPENFRYPYHAANPSDFWNRWHMTLSRWIRDYLFFPVNAKFKGAPLPLYASLIGTMALVGLWHGIGWGFILWGVMHGACLVLYRIGENSRVPAWCWRAFTLIAVMAAWVPFRASTGSQAGAMLSSMFAHWRFGISYGINFYLITALVALYAIAEPYLAGLWSRLEWPPAAIYALRPLLYAFGLLVFLSFDDRSTQFIYFQF